jgi:tRNA(adenine34) deaminase
LEGITTNMNEDHKFFMALAIEEAKAGAASGEQPFGAVVVRKGEVVCRSRSLKVSTSDATAHAETLAIKYATQKLGRRTIPEAVFYSTCEPCPMCLGAVLNAGIGTIVLGARHAHVKALGYHDYSVESFARMTGWNLKIIEGVMTHECVALYRHSAVQLTR